MSSYVREESPKTRNLNNNKKKKTEKKVPENYHFRKETQAKRGWLSAAKALGG